MPRSNVSRGVGLSIEFIDSVHIEIDQFRHTLGLKPWKWNKERKIMATFAEKICTCKEGE